MVESESNEQNLDHQLNNMLSQLRPDAPPVGFTARTMALIRPQFVAEPFRLHWSDFVPAFVAAALGAVILFVWLGVAGAHSIFEGSGNGFPFASISEIQLVVFSSVIGLLVVAYPLLKGNLKRGRSWFFSMM